VIVHGMKVIDTLRLSNLLMLLPVGSSVGPNRVGNLTILNHALNTIGHIDLSGRGNIELYKDNDTPPSGETTEHA
jgi:hypothetical protein